MNGDFGRLGLGLVLIASFVFPANLASAAVDEDPIAKIVQKWGLLGPWSLDCSLPPDHANGTVLAYEIAPDGSVVYRRNFGDVSDEAKVLAAEVSADGLLNLEVYFPAIKQKREFGLAMPEEGSLRAIYNRNEKDEYTIKDGKFTVNHKPTPLMHRCE